MPSELADCLALQYQVKGYTWVVDGRRIIPTADDLEKVLDRAKELLYAEPIPSQLEVGRLLIRRHGDKKFDAYLYQGEIND